MPGKSALLNLLLLLSALIVGAGTMEAAGQAYVALVAKKGKLFAPDAELGWVPLPNLDLARANANGDIWHIATDASGIRGPSGWPDGTGTRLLVLGDSFAFGEGVDLKDRFDTLLQGMLPGLSVVNLGVMGYGPDQEFIRGRRWAQTLRRGDILLLLTYGNDFYDLARTRHAGRAKPWLEDRDGRLVEHLPEIGWLGQLRDRSYIWATLARTVAQILDRGEDNPRLAESGQLYEKLVLQEAAPLLARGVRVLIVHHGDRVFELPFDLAGVFAATCPQLSGCLALDPALTAPPRAEVFLADGHWAAGGHRIAAEQIASYLRTLPALVAGADDEALPAPPPADPRPPAAPAHL
jgi:hypothetical protein